MAEVTFEVGERVYIRPNRWSFVGTVGVISRKTPSGRVEVNGRMYAAGGYPIGDRWGPAIGKLTPEIEAEIAAHKIVFQTHEAFARIKLPRVLPMEQAQSVLAAVNALATVIAKATGAPEHD